MSRVEVRTLTAISRRLAAGAAAMSLAALCTGWSRVLFPAAREGGNAFSARHNVLPSALEIIKRHINAVGGEEAVLRIRSRSVWARYEYPSRQLRGTVQIYAARPNKRIIKIEYPDVGTEVTGFDGTAGWSATPGTSSRLVSGPELAQLRDESEFDIAPGRDTVFRSIETLDASEFEGRPCYRLRIVSTTERTWFEYFDVATGLFAGSLSQHVTPRGPVSTKLIVSDYRPVDGVLFPYRFTFRTGGVEEIVTIVRVEHNTVAPSVFELPQRLRPKRAPHAAP